MKPRDQQSKKIPHINLFAFGREIECEGARNLGLLRDIENTISSLSRLTAQLNSDTNFAEQQARQFANEEDLIDPDNTITEQLEKAQNSINELYGELIERRESGREDPRLTDDDGIEESYTEAIASAADLHNGLNHLRWVIMEHDADLSKSNQTFTDAKEFIKELTS